MRGIPRPWLYKIGDRVELIAYPDGRALVMTAMAMAAHTKHRPTRIWASGSYGSIAVSRDRLLSTQAV